MKELSREQLENMTPERRERYLTRLHQVKRNRKIAAILVVLVVAAVTVAVLSMTVFFNISDIQVSQKGKFYNEKEIIAAAGFNIGSNMIRTDFDKAEMRIASELPYVLSAEITHALSGKVTIKVKDNAAAMLIEIKGGFAIADANGKVLEIIKKKPDSNNLKMIKAGNKITATPGQAFGFSDEALENIYSSLNTAFIKAGIADKITAIDLTNSSSIYAVYQNRFRLNIGNSTELDAKLKAALKTIELEDEADPNAIGEINITIPQKVYVLPLDSLEPVETTAPEDKNNTEESTEAQEEEPADSDKIEEETVDSEDAETGNSGGNNDEESEINDSQEE